MAFSSSTLLPDVVALFCPRACRVADDPEEYVAKSAYLTGGSVSVSQRFALVFLCFLCLIAHSVLPFVRHTDDGPGCLQRGSLSAARLPRSGR